LDHPPRHGRKNFIKKSFLSEKMLSKKIHEFSWIFKTGKNVKNLKNSKKVPSNQRLIKNSTFHEVTVVMAACALKKGHSLSKNGFRRHNYEIFCKKTRFSLRNS
jgi:hypothetical protein